jgi:adenosine deaminase
LGITCHEGECSIERLREALDIPALQRLGHAPQASRSPRLMDEIVKRGIVAEVALTSNIATGAAPSLAEHPNRRFVDAGIRVTLCSEDPVMFATNIGQDYALARQMGFSDAELLAFTRAGIEASFTSTERRKALLHNLDVATPPRLGPPN